jgi:hypothetical protein
LDEKDEMSADVKAASTVEQLAGWSDDMKAATSARS